ncbi:type IV secretory system conjugative DNA transfer family protein, partial [Phocaeicola vulgatus]
MNMDHMFIMRLAALLFGGGIASCLFPGKSRMSHVLFLLLILAETAVAHATIPDGWWSLLPGVVSVLLRLSFKGGTESGKGGKALLSLHATDGTIIRYY